MNSHGSIHTGSASHSGKRGERAVSLIELLGILAVMAILIAALVPALIRYLDRKASELETRELDRLAEGFQQHITRNRNVPDHNNYAQAIAAELGLHTNDITLNDRDRPRFFIIDPSIQIGTNTASPLPYTQTINGTGHNNKPASPRFMLVSSIGDPLPNTVSNGYSSDTNAFNAIWNTADGTVPSGWSWTGKPTDLKIKRINISDLFVRLILSNDTNTLGHYSIDMMATNQMPDAAPRVVNTFFIKSTLLGLHDANGVLQTTEILQRLNSFVFEFGIWRANLFEGFGVQHPGGFNLQAAANLFLAAPWNVNAQNDVHQQDVVNAMENYMYKYMEWAAAGFPKLTGGNAMDAAQVTLDRTTIDLLHKPKN